jgi:hypothetical protein
MAQIGDVSYSTLIEFEVLMKPVVLTKMCFNEMYK